MIGSKLLTSSALVVSLALAACTTTAPVVIPQATGDSRYLTDPRTGYPSQLTPAMSQRFDAGWAAVLSGDLAGASAAFAEIRRREPAYLPARLADAAIAFEEGDPARAASITAEVLARTDYPAARLYRAEGQLRSGQLEEAYLSYQALAAETGATSTTIDRSRQVADRLFDDLMGRVTASRNDEEAIALLRRVLTLRGDASAARVQLVNRLISIRKFDEARRQLEPLIQAKQMDREVQESLVEIEVGKGRYQDAITRLEKLARSSSGHNYDQRLEEIKQKWNDANLPPQYHAALASSAVRRSDVAVLLYWKVPAVRFASNLSEPPIAIDISQTAGREEMVRALALRLFTVDSITRRADPDRIVTAASFGRILTRINVVRGLPCAADAYQDPAESTRAAKLISACGLPFPGTGDEALSGAATASILDRILDLAGSAK